LNKKITKSQKSGGRRRITVTHKNENMQQEDNEYSSDDDENNDEDDNYKSNSNRKYKDIIEGRFDIAKVVYIDRKDDGYTIFGKDSEFSTKTITKLKGDGYKEALKEIKNID
jgi:hypothetical protein